MSNTEFSKKIINWYDLNKRALPWRTTRDPYKIWLSEVILQQTRIVQGLPYYQKFVEAFPDVHALARAPQDKVLRIWQGLGYYSRARNLHACAKKISKEYRGVFPKAYKDLINLPGIGSYTAAAIASISFKEPVAVVDGNVYRVLARVFGIDRDITSSHGKAYFFEKANELIDKARPDLFNQAVMEFGALHCTPQKPKCDDCIFNKVCVANQQHLQTLLPVKIRKQKIRRRHLTYIIIACNDKLLMRKREQGDIWNGLYDFFLEESAKPIKPEVVLKQNKELHALTSGQISKVYTHILSHQHLITRFVWIQISKQQLVQGIMKDRNMKFFSKSKVAELPKPILITRYLHESNYLE